MATIFFGVKRKTPPSQVERTIRRIQTARKQKYVRENPERD